MDKLTRHQRESLQTLKTEFGNRWFTLTETFGLAIRRVEFTLETLCKKEVLQRGVNGSKDKSAFDFWKYKLIEGGESNGTNDPPNS